MALLDHQYSRTRAAKSARVRDAGIAELRINEVVNAEDIPYPRANEPDCIPPPTERVAPSLVC